MPTTDFFSGPGFEPEDVPVKKTSPAQQPVEKQPADDEPFAGMQKLDFDFLGGDDPAVPGETDPGDPFDDFSFQRPAAPAGPAQPARPAPFVFDEEPAPAPFSGVPETRITPAASASLGGTDDAPVRPVSPAQAAPKAAPFVFDFDDAPVERPASRTAASAAPSGEAVCDFGILEEKPAPAPAATPLDGYAPLSLDFLDDAEPIAAVPPAAPAAVKPVEPPRPAQPAPKAAPFVFDFDDAPVERPASRTAASAVPSGEAACAFGSLEEKPARPAAAPLAGYTPLPLDILDDAKPVAAVPPAAPAAVKPAEPPRSAEPVPKAAPFVFDFDDAPVERPASRPGQPGSTASPLYSAADAPTVAFTPAALQADAPTTAFTPVKPDAPAPAAAPQPAPPKMAAQPAPAARAARMAKEKDIGAAVFSALVADDDVPPAPAVPPASGGEELRPSGWPAATPRPANAPRTPRPINWHAPVSPAQRPAPAPARPAPPPAQAPQPPAAETPLDFDFEGAQPFDLFDDVPQSGYTAPQETDQAFPDLYDRDPEEAEPAPRAPQRRTRTGGGSGSGGGRPPRRSTGTARRGIPNKTIFAWAGIVLIALLIILYFVFFGGKDGDVAPGTSGSVPSSTSQPADSTPPDASSAAPVETIPRDEWYMVLANRSSVLPGDFTVAETATVGEAVVDARIAEALRQMVNDAAAAGVKLKPTNGYRSIARQQELWDARVKTLMEGGLSQADAETKAIDYTSAPGTSDHNTGLGLDIVSEDHPAKDAGFAETAAAQWLAEHAADYGFILRYPSDKTEATGMDYEPWHYRYVGSEQAHKIKESGLCLEEYLAQ